MGRYSVKRYKTKRRTRDLDLIHSDLSTPESIQRLKHQAYDEDKPGLGQYYCIHCAKHFQDNKALAQHLKSKLHKRRVKQLKVNPYTTLEAEAAAGLNLEKFVNKVGQYQETEPARKQMESELLSTQIAENDQKDKIRNALLFPDKEELQTPEKDDGKDSIATRPVDAMVTE
ncbi:DEKNAAC102768 [Brettanomyces naardenensis]|uniref:DEKNAAC102768 n=1 Tax=Brettanomyces naardenensis TaxID=13370 RepID=A0A448YKG2_BRENA|nr:DEKNAAC102768 [Brettanomyces naardenensis]